MHAAARRCRTASSATPRRERQVGVAIAAITGLRRLRQDAGLGPREPLEIAVSAGADGDALRAQADLLRGPRARGGRRHGRLRRRAGPRRRRDASPCAATGSPAALRERLRKRLADAEAERDKARTKLANARFVERAPAAVVSEERDRVARFGREADELRASWRRSARSRRARARGAAREPGGVRRAARARSAWRPLLAALDEPAAAVPRHPRRRHERQDVDRAASAPRCWGRTAWRPAPTCRRTCRGSRSACSSDGEPLGEDAAGRRRRARRGRRSRRVERQAGEPLTQFEALTAAAFVALADGRRGRSWRSRPGSAAATTRRTCWPRRSCSAPASGLDHTAQLGPTREAIAGEKLAVVHPGARVVCGEADAEIAPVLERLARRARRGSEVLLLPPGADVPDAPALASPRRVPAREPGAGAGRLRAAARRVASTARRALAAAAAVRVPGRLETVGTAAADGAVDGAHNPHARGRAGGGAAGAARRAPAARAAWSRSWPTRMPRACCASSRPHVDACVATQTGSAAARPAAAELAARPRRVGLFAVVEPRSGGGAGPGARPRRVRTAPCW